jgi:hypothetical protein
MNEKETSEIRRRLRPEKNNIGRIRGCYVNDTHEIISEFDFNFGLISTDESDEILSLLRRTLSGSIGRNLIDISFTNQQVSDSEEHRLLSALRNSSLSDNEAVSSFFKKVTPSIDIEGSYILILANDKYDIFKYDENDEKSDSSETFSYIICAACPIKNSKPLLGFNLNEKKFKNIIKDSIIASPEIGFMFPAFDDRNANIYNALFYTRDVSVSHNEFLHSTFGFTINKTASEQTECIASILSSTIKEDCDLEFIQSVQGQLIELHADHKNNKEEEPLMLSARDMKTLLRCGGASEDAINVFNEKFEDDFGAAAEIPPANVIDIKKFELKTPDVTVKVPPEHSDLIQTRVIDGTKYILIRADGDVEVNGIKINMND